MFVAGLFFFIIIIFSINNGTCLMVPFQWLPFQDCYLLLDECRDRTLTTRYEKRTTNRNTQGLKDRNATNKTEEQKKSTYRNCSFLFCKIDAFTFKTIDRSSHF